MNLFDKAKSCRCCQTLSDYVSLALFHSRPKDYSAQDNIFVFIHRIPIGCNNFKATLFLVYIAGPISHNILGSSNRAHSIQQLPMICYHSKIKFCKV